MRESWLSDRQSSGLSNFTQDVLPTSKTVRLTRDKESGELFQSLSWSTLVCPQRLKPLFPQSERRSEGSQKNLTERDL